MLNAKLVDGRVYSLAVDAFTLYEKSRFGEKKDNRIEYSIFEALFLVQKGKMKLFLGNKEISFDKLIVRLKKIDKKVELKYIVFSDLRNKGYVLKTALKFGAEFRVYEKGKRPGEEHARWILHTASENDLLKWHDFTAKSRIAHSTKKNLLLGIVDDERDVTYYEVNWMRT
ncbi:MAG: tRNA-intron lyase [Nanoarchaeota archaeon]